MRKPIPVFIYDQKGRLLKAATSGKDAATFCKVSAPTVYAALNSRALVRWHYRLFRSAEDAQAYFAPSRNGGTRPDTLQQLAAAIRKFADEVEEIATSNRK